MKPINLAYSVDDINVILTALSKLPFEVSAPIIQNIHMQVAPQLEQAEPAETDTKGEPEA